MRFKNKNADAADASCRKVLHELRTCVSGMKSVDPMVRHITNYAIVVSSGALERAAKDIIADYISETKSQSLLNYIDKTIRQNSMNPSIWAICKMLDKFDMGWGALFEKQTKKLPEATRRALGSIVSGRNSIAHGQPQTAAFANIVSYYCRSRLVIKEIENVLA